MDMRRTPTSSTGVVGRLRRSLTSVGAKRKRVVLTVLLAVATVGLAGACSSSSSSSDQGAAGEKPKLSVAVFFTNAAFAHVYIAKSEGYFDAEGVDVTLIDNAGSNTLTQVTSGRADLGMIGAGAPLLAAKQGAETSIAFAHIGNANGGVVVGTKGVTTLQQIKRVGATGLGTSSYGFCAFYNQTLHLNWDIVPFQDVQAMRGALAGGQVDGACNSYLNFRDQIDSGALNVIVDTRDKATRQKLIGQDYPEAAIFGMTSKMQANHDGMVRFMKAIGRAQKFIESNQPAAIAASLHKLPVFENQDVKSITAQVEDTIPYYAPNGGFITPDTWNFALTQYKLWGLDLDPQDPTFSYDKRVDMSYYKEALGTPAGS